MWRAVSLVMAIAAIVGVFVAIPIISAYAFWFLVAAIIVWLGADIALQNKPQRAARFVGSEMIGSRLGPYAT
jgi:type IV secretory pathway VirB3-like protein